MITPRFKLTQDDTSVTFNIRAPYCSLRELDIDVDGNVFLFVCKPYYLRLKLPGSLIDDHSMKSSYDTDSGEFIFMYAKQFPGEFFKDLDLVTKLLTPKIEACYENGSMPIEILTESEAGKSQSEKKNHDLQFGFGFALRAHQDFVKISKEFDEVFEIDPCEVPLPERAKLRLQYEQGKFNVDHYLTDYFDNDEICEIISQKCPFSDIKSPTVTFTDRELDFLKNLPNIEYNLTKQQIKYCHYGLIDILFAYCYDRRSTFFEGSIESGWTIVKLAATLSWLDAFEDPKQAVSSAFRRSVIYPLYRHFDLSQTVFEDLKKLVTLDEKYIIQALINIYYIFLKGDCGRYVLNNLFIKDYITYIINWDRDLWKSTVKDVLAIEIKKDALGLNLSEIEDFTLSEKFAAMKVMGGEIDSDDTNYSSSDSSEDSSSSEYSSDSEETDTDEGTVTTLQSDDIDDTPLVPVIVSQAVCL